MSASTDSEFSRIIHKINTNEERTIDLLRQVHSGVEQEIHFLSNMTVNTLEAMPSIHEMEHCFATFLTSVEILFAGRLHTRLVSYSILHDAIVHISETLQETHSPWQIIRLSNYPRSGLLL